LRRGGSCGLPTAGRDGQRDAGEEEKAGQGLPRLLALHGLQQAGQGPGAAGGGSDGYRAQRVDLLSCQHVKDIQAPGGWGAPNQWRTCLRRGVGAVSRRKGRQNRRGAAQGPGTLTHHRQFVAGQVHKQVVGLQPAVGRGGFCGLVDRAEV